MSVGFKGVRLFRLLRQVAQSWLSAFRLDHLQAVYSTMKLIQVCLVLYQE